MKFIENNYTIDTILKKKNLDKDNISFSFRGKAEKCYYINCNYSILTKEYTFSIRECNPENGETGVVLEAYSLLKLESLKDLLKNRMKKLGFKSLEGGEQLSLDINKVNNQLSLDDVITHETKLKELILKECEGVNKKRISGVIDAFLEYPYNYNTDFEEYIERDKGFYDNSHIDNIDVLEDRIKIQGVFREDEVENIEAYERAGFPRDVDELELFPKEILLVLNNTI